MVRVFLAASVASSALAWPVLAADAPSMEAQRFGARPSIEEMSLSPNGTLATMILTGKGQGTTLYIADLVKGGDPRPILRSSGNPDQLKYCGWASDTRLVCRIYMIDNGHDHLNFTRMVSLNVDGSDAKVLTAHQTGELLGMLQHGGSVIDWAPNGVSGSVLMTRQFVPEVSIGTLVGERREGLGVELVDATSLTRKIVEQPASEAEEYISDGHGNVRIRGLRPKTDEGYDRDRVAYQYRLAGSRDWKPFGEVRFTGSGSIGFNPEAVDSTANVAYGFDYANGHAGLYSVALDGSLKRTLLVANKDVDIDSLIQIGRQHRVVGASWITDRRTQQFFDPELQQLRAALSKAIPNKPLIDFIDASADEKRILLLAGADNDPGTYYVFDKTSRHLEEIAAARPELANTKLATMQAITYPAADGTLIPAYLTLPPGSTGKNLPTVVMPHGGPESRDEWGFDYLPQFFAARGYAVIQPNFRGSTGYGDAWFKKNGFQSWKTAIGDVNDAARWISAQGIAAPGKVAIVGWSYGGYAALQTSVVDAGLFRAIVAVAPVTDLDMLREEHRGYTDFIEMDERIGHGEHVREGSPLKNAEKIKAPVLMFHGDQDVNVGIAESRAMAGKLKGLGKQVELVEFKGLDHQLDDSAARTAMLDKVDRFLRASLGLSEGH